jgi:predicted dehydrogenase
MMDPIRVGVLGAGWGAGLHLTGFGSTDGVVLAGIASRSREPAERLADEHGVARVFETAKELIDAVDLVSVATPPDSHHEFTLAAVAAGRHVFCDKPLAVTAAQALEMTEAAHAAGVHHATGFIWRGDPALVRMRAMLADGAVGRVVELHSTCALGVPVLPMNWMYDRDRGGGALAQHGSHVIDRARWLLGRDIVEVNGGLAHDVETAPDAGRFHNVMDVFAWPRKAGAAGGDGAPARRKVTADTGYDFRAVFADGTRASFWEAWHLTGSAEDHIVAYGDRGTLEWRGAGGLWLHRLGVGVERVEVPQAAGSGAHTPREIGEQRWRELAGRFVTAVRETPPAAGAPVTAEPGAAYPTLDDGWRVAAISDAVRASHESGTWESTR